MVKIIEQDKEIELIGDSLTINPIVNLDILDLNELIGQLKAFIFYQNEPLNKIIDDLDYIIEESLGTEESFNPNTLKIQIENIKQWLMYTVIPNIYASLDSEYANEFAEERNHGGTIEHKHKSAEYWHPETRIHIKTKKSELPQGHITKQSESKETTESNELNYNKKHLDIIRNTLIEQLTEFDNKQENIIIETVDLYKVATNLYERIYIEKQSLDKIKNDTTLIAAFSTNDVENVNYEPTEMTCEKDHILTVIMKKTGQRSWLTYFYTKIWPDDKKE